MKSKMRKIRRYWPLYLMIRQYNFQKGIYGSPFIGLKNFKFLFASKDAWIIMRNTIGYNLIFIVLGTVCAIAVAILLCEIRSKISKKNISDLYSDSVSGFDGNCQLSGICIPQ